MAKWTLEILRFVWMLPVTLIGLCLLMLTGEPRAIHRKHGLIFFVVPGSWPSKRFVAVSMGSFLMFSSVAALASKTLVAHEEEHLRQTGILGPLMLVLYPLASLLALLYKKPYKYNWFEICARKVSGEE